MGEQWKPDPGRIAQWFAVVWFAVLLDMTTGRHVAQLAQRYKRWAEDSWQPREATVPPPMASALQEEARTITRRAAEQKGSQS